MKSKKQIKSILSDLQLAVDRDNFRVIEALTSQLHLSIQNYIKDTLKNKAK